MARDPVCAMEVDENTAQDKSEYMGETYYFCSPSCKKAFDNNPDVYAVVLFLSLKEGEAGSYSPFASSIIRGCLAASA